MRNVLTRFAPLGAIFALAALILHRKARERRAWADAYVRTMTDILAGDSSPSAPRHRKGTRRARLDAGALILLAILLGALLIGAGEVMTWLTNSR